MSDAASPQEALEQEIARLRKVNAVLMRRVQRSLDAAGSDYGLFEQNIHLERLVVERTAELRERNTELERAQARAEAAAQAKGRFLANMSHELRTPLNVVIGATQVLAEADDLPPAHRQLLQTMLGASEHLLGLIDDILDFSRADDGALHLYLAPVDIPALLEDALTAIRLTPMATGLHLSAHIAPTVPQWIEADPRRLRQVLVNLISNACKFTDQGEIRLEICVTDGRLAFCVRDSGIGIAPEQVEHLFGRFSQADETDSRRAGGVGLGLAICHQLISLWGGTVQIESTPSVGTGITFTHPLRAVASPPIPEPRPPDALPKLRRVLLVDDHPINRLVARRLLEQLHVVVEEADSGASALHALQSATTPPDAILMDCQMPDMDGFETTRRVRALPPPLRSIPIIALTASALDADRERCFQAGMDAYLAKPVRREDLLKTLRALA